MEKLPTFTEALRIWLKVALYSFGGPAGQIAVMHKLIVEEKKWIGENRFLHALNYCMLLPGPEAQQLATYIGWLLHKTRGGIVAGALFVLPGFLSILVLSILYALWKDLTIVQGIFYGIKPAVLAIVVGAVIKIGKKALKNEVMAGIAVLAFIAIFFFKIPFPVIVLPAGLIGFIGGKIWEEKFLVIKGHADKKDSEEGLIDRLIQPEKPSLSKTLGTAFFWLALWLVPVVLLVVSLGLDNVFTKESIFFSKSAVVTFGGAYSVLAYISQQAVETYGWVKPGEMLDGLGMAETTPGPLIQVVQFVGFMGAFRNAGSLDPVLAGVLASVLVTWVTYLLSFFFIFTGAPYIENLRGNKSLTTALSGITAAVVGVILNLGIWFSLHTLFGKMGELNVAGMHIPLPVCATVDWGAVFIMLAALFIYFKLKWDMLKTIGVCITLGLAFKFFIL
ncbi:MAG: chromate efflux transporter [Saprospiraceae bacterium]|nr:MAG: chromate efflux transporter [Saprospiraceae bacterium]